MTLMRQMVLNTGRREAAAFGGYPLSGCAGLSPRESMSLDFRVASLPYKSSSFATLFRGQNKTLYVYL